MSIRIMAKVWALNIPSGEKFVALALADNASDEGVCWPSIETIAKKCSISRRSAIDQVAKLRGLGLIKTEPRGHKKSLRFDFDLASLDRLLKSACGAKSAPQSQDLTCNGCTAEGGFEVQNLHPEPSVVEEPSREGQSGEPSCEPVSLKAAPPSEPPPKVPRTPRPRQPRPRDPLFDAMAQTCYGTTPLTQGQSGWIAKAIGQLLEVQPDLTPEMILEFAKRRRKEWAEGPVNPGTYMKHWRVVSSEPDTIEAVVAKAKACRAHPDHVASCYATEEEKAEFKRLVALYKQLKAQQP